MRQLHAALALSAAALGALGAVNPASERMDIFTPTPRFPCFRQPAIAAAGPGGRTVLAFAENRNISQCAPAFDATGASAAPSKPRAGHPDELGSLQLRRSTDGGKTWSPLQSLYVGNIDFYAVTVLPGGDKVVLLLQAEGAGGNAVLTSDDAGVTWATAPSPLKVALPPGITGIKPTCGHGVTVQEGLCGAVGGCAHAGRIVVPMVCTNSSAGHSSGDKGACPSCVACLVTSDDGGKTWTIGGFGPPGSRESEVAQVRSHDEDATFYLNARNMGKTPGHRFAAECTGGGSACGKFVVDEALEAPVTPHWTGIVDAVVGVGDPVTLVFSGPGSATARANMTMRTSTDGGATWSAATTVWPGPAAYSDLAVLGGGSAAGDAPAEATVAMIFENGVKTFADRVSVQLFTVSA